MPSLASIFRIISLTQSTSMKLFCFSSVADFSSSIHSGQMATNAPLGFSAREDLADHGPRVAKIDYGCVDIFYVKTKVWVV